MSVVGKNREVPLRVAIVGAASTGKTSLSRELARVTGAGWLGEGLRGRLERAGRGPLRSWPIPASTELLRDLHFERLVDEKRLDSFVADTSCLDPVATGLHLGLLGDGDHELLREARRALATYDAVFVLPGGVIPYVRDGLRPEDELGQLAYGYLLWGLLASGLQASRLIRIPESIQDNDRRVDFAVQRLNSLGLQGIETVEESDCERLSSASRRVGKVFLVGAGPGTPELLTQRAAALIASADVIAHDRLVPAGLLALAAPGAELLAVGHRGRGSKQVKYRIHPAVINRAQRGLRVVRLKAGDPLIFGRGGEEAEALNEAGIRFEIVPGISAALGAAAAAGIPLTHRDHASDVTFATGHDLSSGRENGANFAGMGKGRGTLVLYMATRKLGENLARIVECGRKPSTPAAYIASAARFEQVVVTGTLADLAERCADIDRSMPALVIVGDVVNCRARMAWCEQRPLAGRRFLLSRGRAGPSQLAQQLRELGASVVEEPKVEARGLEDPGALDACILGLESSLSQREADPSVLLIASAEAAGRLVERWRESGRDLREFPRVPLLALGPETGEALLSHGLRATQTSRGHCIEGLRGLKVGGSVRLWVLGSDRGRPSLMEDVAEMGWRATYVPVYQLRRQVSGLDPGVLDAGLFMASSLACELLKGDGILAERLHRAPAFAIGPKTRRALEECGHAARPGELVMVGQDRREDVVEVLIARFAKRQPAHLGKVGCAE